jgi:adenylate cyclase
MNFSRFIKYSILFFLLCLLVNTAKPTNNNNSAINIGQPLIFEIPGILQPNPIFYTSLFVDKGNRLFITTDHDVYIYNGVNFQKIAIEGKAILAGDNQGRVLLAGNHYLSIISLNPAGGYRVKRLIDSTTAGTTDQITGLGFDKETIYFSTGTKLWAYHKKPLLIDSSAQPINIHSAQKGLVFYNVEKGFYRFEGKSVIPLNIDRNHAFIKVVTIADETLAVSPVSPWFYSPKGKISLLSNSLSKYLNSNETIRNFSVAGSYFFISTSTNKLLMFDFSGNMVFHLDEFGTTFSSVPIEICTSDDINFFAITPTQIFRFINPNLIQLYNSKANLKGRINETTIFNNKLYTASSEGLYLLDKLGNDDRFNLIAKGEFNSLLDYQNTLYAIGVNGLYIVNQNEGRRVSPERSQYLKTSFIKSFPPKAIFLNMQGIAIADITPPYLLNLIQNDSQQPFINFIVGDSAIYLKTADQKLYSCSFDLKGYLNRPKREYVPILFINEKYYKHDLFGYKTNIGRTFSGQPIINYHSSSFPNQQILKIEKKVLYTVGNTFEINYAHLDSDSILWISTTQGLIKVSNSVFGHKRTNLPLASIFSIASYDGDISHPIYNELVSDSNTLKAEYRIKHGSSIEFILSGIGGYSWNNLAYLVTTEGSKSDNNEWSVNPKFLFTHLQPGNYTFNAKIRDEFGLESPALLINLKVIPNFFQTKFTQIALAIFIIMSLITFYIWRNYNHALDRFKLESIINRRTEELVKEKEKTDNLLARVLPRETATELKETGKVSTQKFNIVTVLFSDIQGFTKITDDLNPESLIDQLDKFFLYFDSVVDKYKIEKIKTIGDAYMCAGGIPHKNRTNPVEVVLAALEMMYFMREINLEHNPGQDLWDLRIGIDTGPVIAGVVGRNKLTYDIWGTTVNTASRMESSGEVGKINISGNTHMLVQEYFLCTYRGKMPIKNKGDIEMYFVEGIKPALSTNLDCFRPNAAFQIQLQFLRFGDLEEFILEKLEKGLPKNLYYHNLKHTVDVYTQVVLIGREEKLSQEELLLVQTAALLHDAGHLIDYDTHEEMGVKLAREILPDYLYTERQIEIISDLIMITKLPPKPRNLLEAIMCDADLDYLGRTDFIPVSNMLYKELHEHGRIGTIQEWNELQIKFIEKHQYFTNTARRLRNVNKNSQLENIKRWIEKNKL